MALKQKQIKIAFVFAVTGLLVNLQNAQGQDDSSHLILRCDPYSLWMLHAIVEKVSISQEKQELLIELFGQEKDAFCAAAANNQIKNYKEILLRKVAEVLSDEEMEQLLANRPISKLNELLLFKNKLKLTESQCDSVEAYHHLLMHNIKNDHFFNVSMFERLVLKNVLTFNQFFLYLKPKIAHRVGLKTLDDWNFMLFSGLAVVTDSTKIWEIIENYNYTREAIIEIHQDNRPERNAMLRDLDRDKDPLLKSLDVAIKEEERRKINMSKGIEGVKKFQGNYNY